MQCDYAYSELNGDDWHALHDDLDAKRKSKILGGLLSAFKDAGAVLFLEESAYIDRDFSAAYTAFYSTLYRHRPKYCRRIHFFSSTLPRVWDAEDAQEMSVRLEADGASSYLGYIVIRPIGHAPVSRALLSSRHGLPATAEIAVRSTYSVHVLGAELKVEGAPLTEQDTLTGSCAQATLWVAGRHLHNRHAMPWYSVIDITEAAVKPTDSILSASLPAGSESLSADNMVRALRAMGEHPVVYRPKDPDEVKAEAEAQAEAERKARMDAGIEDDDRRDEEEDEAEDAVLASVWDVPPARTVSQYLDSGIPVIIGLRRGVAMGHAVVAIGTVAGQNPVYDADDPAPSDCNTHIIIHDDQRGPYQALAIKPPDDEGQDGSQSGADAIALPPLSQYSLDDAIFLIVPLPNKVYLKAEVAETMARDKIERMFEDQTRLLKMSGLEKDELEGWHVDPGFYAVAPTGLLARTYLTTGWKYQQRILRNSVSDELKIEVNAMHLPRYVWVTEFSLPADAEALDPCDRRVRGHVLIDATGNRFDDNAVLLAHLPGILMGEQFDADRPTDREATRLHVLPDDAPYFPKIRGQRDFNACISGAA